MSDEESSEIKVCILKKNLKLLKQISKIKNIEFDIFINNLLNDLAEIYRKEIIFPF